MEASTTPTALDERVAAQIRADGPLPFSVVMDAALYDADHGFYQRGGAAGRRGDFLTSPEVGPLFGAVVARALDRWWDDAGRPDPFVVTEVGAGRGALAIAVLAAAPRCASSLRYVLVEQSPVLRRAQADHLTVAGAWDPGASVPPASGPVVFSVPTLVAHGAAGVVVANELLDNLPVDLLERDGAGWRQVLVGVGPDDSLTEVLGPTAVPPRSGLDEAAAAVAAGARIPVATRAVDYLGETRRACPRCRIVVIDYLDTTAALAARPVADWLRTYRAHGRGGPPLERLGTQDITCQVPVDQITSVLPPVAESSQADFLVDHGIDELVREGRSRWEARAHVGDLDAVRARSRIGEAEALLDPGGLGAFGVVEWAPIGP